MDDLFSTTDTWRQLYLAAMDFKKLAPWQWMSDEELFGVQNPTTGEIGYCCIMGMLGEVLALAVYQGSEGLQTYLDILSGDNLFEEIFSSQKCLMASFENRQDLGPADLKLIKELGLKFRGANSWPLLRNHRPGYFPWYITLEEAEFLTLALQQSLVVANRVLRNKKTLKPPKPGEYLVRMPEGAGAELTWKDAWVRPDFAKPPFVVPQPDVDTLLNLKKHLITSGDTWEMDYFRVPMPIKEKRNQRPYYPWGLLAVDQFSGLALVCHLAAEETYKTEFQQAVVKVLQQTNKIPKRILVGRPELFKLLEPVKSVLNFKMKIANRLKILDQARESLFALCFRHD
jgi:hypothetical protein